MALEGLTYLLLYEGALVTRDDLERPVQAMAVGGPVIVDYKVGRNGSYDCAQKGILAKIQELERPLNANSFATSRLSLIKETFTGRNWAAAVQFYHMLEKL